MRFGVLGPLEVTDDSGRLVDVGGRQPKVVLAALAAASGRAVSAATLIDAIWGNSPPASASGTLQTYVSRLRRVLSEAGAATVVLDDAGYRLALADGDTIDLEEFGRLAVAGESLLHAGRVGEARDQLARSLELWRGPALLDLVDSGAGVAQAAQLDERRLAVLESRIEADLALGRHAQVVGELVALVAEHPLREGLHAKLAVALYRSGRQADALRALASAAAILRGELGLEPSRQLRDLEAAVLAHDPSLDLAPPASEANPPAPPPAPAPPGHDGAPLVGRDLELRELLAAYKEAAEDARFVVIEGEPGIGKTRLAEELARAANSAGSLVVWGRSNELGNTPALWPWLPVLRAVLSEVDEVPAGLGEVLAGEVPLVAGQGGAVQFERFDAIAAVLEQAGAVAPVVVLLDDLQWADAASLELLQLLASRLHRGVLVVTTLRPPAVGGAGRVTDALGAIARRHGSRRLRLRGLTPEATGELLDAVAPAAVSPEDAARIHDRADGNPFYAIELARLLGEGGADGGVPASVRDVVRQRLRALPGDTVTVLSFAAVTGREVDVPFMLRAYGCELATCLDWLDPATEHRLLVPSDTTPGTLRFEHALVREVLLEDLTPLTRAKLHLQVADALVAASGGSDADIDRDHAELLAEHLWQAVSLAGPERAAAALERAAEVAVNRVSYAGAEDLLGRAAQLRRTAASSPEAKQRELATLLRLLEVMQATRFYSGTDRATLERAHELAAQLELDDVLRKLEWTAWAALSTSGRLAEALPAAIAYLERWGDDARPEVASAAHAMWGVDECSRGRILSAAGWLDRAAALLEGLPPPEDDFEGQHRLIAQAFGLFAHAAHGDMSVDDAMAGYEFLAAVVPPVAVPAVCAFGGTTMSVHTRWDLVDRLVHRALDADPSAQMAWFGGQLLMFRGLVLAASGSLDEGVAVFSDGRARFRSVGGRVGTASFQALLGELLARAGRLSEATELVAGARRLNEETGEGWNDVTIAIAEGVVAHASGDHPGAAERLRAALAIGDEQGSQALAARATRVAAEMGVAL